MLMSAGRGSTLAGVFTTSDTAAAPVQRCRRLLPKNSNGPFAVLVNAGNANAFTGRSGMDDAQRTCEAIAERAGLKADSVFSASTGVIGEPLRVDVLERGFDALVATDGDCDWRDAAGAIMTTDTFPKGAGATAMIGNVEVRIAGIAKGAGMIAPNMATMLGFLATDAAIDAGVLGGLLGEATRKSFNSITVDSDMSTNDTVFLAASGTAGNARIGNGGDSALDGFRAALDEVMQDLACQIVRDGEGATKFITIDVTGAASYDAARHIGLSIANAPLVKTAIAGEDANWGRIVMAIGKAGQGVDQDDIGIRIGGVPVARDGARVPDFDEGPVAAHMRTKNIDIEVEVGPGKGCARVWTCDLTHEYIKINADYRS